MMTQTEILKWLNVGHDRKLDVKFHCYGVRVTLYYGYNAICTHVSDTIEDAFEVVVKNYETLLCATLNEQLIDEESRAKRNLEESERALANIRKKIDASIVKLSVE